MCFAWHALLLSVMNWHRVLSWLWFPVALPPVLVIMLKWFYDDMELWKSMPRMCHVGTSYYVIHLLALSSHCWLGGATSRHGPRAHCCATYSGPEAICNYLNWWLWPKYRSHWQLEITHSYRLRAPTRSFHCFTWTLHQGYPDYPETLSFSDKYSPFGYGIIFMFYMMYTVTSLLLD